MHNTTDLNEAISPALLLSETHFHGSRDPGVLAEAADRVAAQGFYRLVEIPDIPDPGDRRRLGEIVRRSGLGLTYWMSFVLGEEGLNLSSVDEDLRRRSVGRVQEHLPAASECGATCLGVLSGPDPGPELREQATAQLYLSLCELAQAAQQHSMRLGLEPLDRGAHKNGLLGPTPEAARLLRQVRRSAPNTGILWDTAHSALCGERPEASLRSFCAEIRHVHLANAVLDRADPRYGDHHMPPGPPGFLTVDRGAEILAAGLECGYFGPARGGLSVEIRTPPGGDPWETERQGREILYRMWERLMERESTP